MILNPTQCCAIKEISSLSNHATPEEAMRDFVRVLRAQSFAVQPLQVPGLITFTAVVGLTTSKDVPDTYRYGQRFKAYILKHKLGKVSISPLTTNRLNHPTHKIRAFMWQPSPARLQTWATRHGF